MIELGHPVSSIKHQASSICTMRACIQRVSEAQVAVADTVVGRIASGLVVLLGVAGGDGEEEVNWLAEKIVGLRVFEDDEGKMNRSLAEVGGAMLVVSQFTLYGDCRRGRHDALPICRARARGGD
jgi:D-tyrosyl-tRNA(Tyr) deacylase